MSDLVKVREDGKEFQRNGPLYEKEIVTKSNPFQHAFHGPVDFHRYQLTNWLENSKI